MRKRMILPSELAYVLGLVLIAFGCALMEKSDFGVSMIVAPAYLVYRFLSPVWSFFTFGTAEYCLQAVLLLLMCLILRKFRLSWLFSFVTAVIYGFVLDGCMTAVAALPVDSYVFRGIWYVAGMLFSAAGVSMMFHTYIAPEVYELLVKEVSAAFRLNINKFKTAYDCTSLVAAVIMSFAFFGFGTFVGVKWGTIFCALINGFTIGCFSKLYEKCFDFQDKLPFRKFFTGAGAEG